MNFEIAGKLIKKYDTQVISDRFKKREFVIEVKETTAGGFEFVETIKFQTTQNKCETLDHLKEGQDVMVHFNLKGKSWEKNGEVNYFNNLDAWKVEEVSAGANSVEGTEFKKPVVEVGNDDLPF